MSQVQESEYEVIPPGKEQFPMQENPCYGDIKIGGPINTEVSKKSAAGSDSKKVLITLIVSIVLIAALTLAVAIICIAFAIEISNLKKSTQHTSADFARKLEALDSLLETVETLNITSEISKSTQNTSAEFARKLEGLNSLLESLNESFNSQVNNTTNHTQNEIQTLRDYIQGKFRPNTVPASSCAALPPFSSSGNYWVRGSHGSAVHVYCDTSWPCGTGRWMRVVDLNMTNSSHQCPSGLMERTIPEDHMEPRTCVSTNTSANSCSHTFFDTSRINYSQICGKIQGYQILSTNGFLRQQVGIDSVYVDGVSLTHGRPRQHIWTFASARDRNSDNRCPGEGTPPSYVGTDYFCDAGANTVNNARGNLFFEVRPLWDYEEGSTNCDSSSPPWFYKQLGQSTSDRIEMRVCRDEVAVYEDVAIEIIEIYVQ